MHLNGLTNLQRDILEILADLVPRWTLSGGAALVGFHLHHRTTRDLDLFWHDTNAIEEARRACISRLQRAGLALRELRTSPGFAELEVRRGKADAEEVVLVDLIAEPVANIEKPLAMPVGVAVISVDSPHEILVNKLCALLHRSELRDLDDVRALLESGLSLDRALEDAPRKDGGFSALVLSWLLSGWDLRSAARAAELAERDIDALDAFRGRLLEHLVRRADES